MCKIFSNTTKQAHQNADRVSGCCSGEEMIFLANVNRQIDSIDYVLACELGFMKKSYIPVRNFLRIVRNFLHSCKIFTQNQAGRPAHRPYYPSDDWGWPETSFPRQSDNLRPGQPFCLSVWWYLRKILHLWSCRADKEKNGNFRPNL